MLQKAMATNRILANSLDYYQIFKDSISIIIIIIKVNYNYQKKFKESFEVIFIRRRLSDHNKITFAIKYLHMSGNDIISQF